MATKTATKTASKSTKSKTAKPAGQETNLIRRITVKPKSNQIGDFSSGDTVSVYVKVREGEKERIQMFKGTVIKMQGSGVGRSFTVRKISAGVGVERTFPFNSPFIDKVEVLTKGNVRRAKLYYLRSLEGKAAKIDSELVSQSSSAAE